MQKFPKSLLLHLTYPVIDEETGVTLEHHQLKCHPRLMPIWNHSYSNKMGHLFQGIGLRKKGPKHQRMAGMDTFHVIWYEDIP